MTKRETAFLLIGLGFGLMFAEAAILEVLMSLYRMKFIVAYAWDWIVLAAPIVFLVAGIILVIRRPSAIRPATQL